MEAAQQGYFWQTPVVPDNGVWDRGKFISYTELWHLGDVLVDATDLHDRGLALLFVDNSAMSIAAYLGFLRAGHVVFLGDHRDPPSAQAAWVRQYQPEVVWGPTLQLPPDSEFEQCSFEDTTVLLHRGDGAGELHPELGLLLATSGSTGDSKVARLSYNAVQANAVSIVEALVLDANERPVTSLHMSFAYGLSVINSHLACGASLACTNAGLQDDEFWYVIDEHACTSLAGVPFQYNLLRQLDYWRDPKPTIKTYTQAGGALAPEQQEFHQQNAKRAGARLVIMYGQTEATARITVVPPESLSSHLGSIGLPIPGGQLSIPEPDQATGEGELVYEGANVMLGYATSRQCLSKGDELGGELHTGDLARVDDDGYFWVVGRIKRIVKPFGIRVSLDHLEQVTAEWTGSNTAVVGNDDGVTVLVGGDEATATGLADHIARRIGLPETCVRVANVDEIPLDGRNKIDYAAVVSIVEALQQDTPLQPETDAAGSDIEQQLLDIWSRILRIKNIKPTDNIFLDLGADSITAVTALLEIESITGREINLADLFRHPTVTKQVDLLTTSDDGLSTGREGDSLRTIVGHATSNQLLLFSPSAGHEWTYLHLARRLANSVGIQVLRDWRLVEGRFVPQTIDDLADRCVDRLDREDMLPPVLGGYSFGGIIAYEVAVRLEQAGKPPAGIILIDALLRSRLKRTARHWAAKLLWHNTQHDYHFWNLPLIGKALRPEEPALRLFYSLFNSQADYATRPIGPMVDYVLGPGSGIDPELPIVDAFSQLYVRLKERTDPKLVKRVVLPGVNAQTALEHLLVFATNVMLNNDYVPSAPTNVPILFITPRQTPSHQIWHPYARGRFDSIIVDGVHSEGYFDAHANMIEPDTIPRYQDELISWVKDRITAAGNQ